MTLTEALWILYTFLIASGFLILIIIIQAIHQSGESTRQGAIRDLFFRRYFDGEDVKLPLFIKNFYDVLLDIETQIKLEDEVRSRIIADVEHRPFIKRQFWRLDHPAPSVRMAATVYVAGLRTKKSIKKLLRCFYIEPRGAVRFALAYGLRDSIGEKEIAYLLETLEDESTVYGHWIATLIANRHAAWRDWLVPYLADERIEVARVLLEVASKTNDPRWRPYCLGFIDASADAELRHQALEALLAFDPEALLDPLHLLSSDEVIRRHAIRAAANRITPTMTAWLIDHLDGSALDDERVKTLARIVYESKPLLLQTLDAFAFSKRPAQQAGIARVLSHHIDYLIVRMSEMGGNAIGPVIDKMLELGIVEDFIDFLNHNKHDKIIELLLPFVRRHGASNSTLLDQFTIYLDVELLRRVGLMKKPQPPSKREKSPRDKGKTRWIITWIIVATVILPFLAFTLELPSLLTNNSSFAAFVVRLNQLVIIYFLSINSVYLLLLIISLFGAMKRERLWHGKRATLLFEHELLPTISIIAPAYNEQLSIVESLTSLLNLKYPHYEVIVVNDGSKDATLETLIDQFQLERKHPFFKEPLETKGLRGVYVNAHIPNLIVIDKHNGGKADALNMGINAARGRYVCGIDADSLLDENALLKMMSVTLDDATPFIALGGNITPVNGAIVDRGKIEKSGLGKKTLVRFQTLEYLRAFTSGRIGWSELRSLLIISGAFGIFERKALIETGGYLTSSGKMRKDTVGEDMELVVRLTYQALAEKRPYRVAYVHNAHCYTELPADLTSLLKQRNRWQRGLLDILSYHRRILFRPRYKQPGMIGFPYFFIFEMLGPFVEAIGYLALLLGLALGLLNLPIVIVMLAVTIAFGMVISLFSLFVSERKSSFYPIKDMVILLLFAIIENFGFRQLMSLHRIRATFSALTDGGSWGSQNRQGFQKTTP